MPTTSVINLKKEGPKQAGLTPLAVLLVAIIILGVLSLGWSVWYWTFHPRAYTSTMEIHEICDNDSTSPYCYGYAAGYNWCIDQAALPTRRINVTK